MALKTGSNCADAANPPGGRFKRAFAASVLAVAKTEF
jgi:hypothetical protein